MFRQTHELVLLAQFVPEPYSCDPRLACLLFTCWESQLNWS